MSCVIVPDYLRDEIYRRVDEAIALVPGSEPDRDIYYRHVLSYFNDHGFIPDFSIVANPKHDVCPQPTSASDK
jgi:hypothetical protein